MANFNAFQPLSPFQMLGSFANQPAANAGSLNSMLWAVSGQTPFLNDFQPVITPFQSQFLGMPEQIGSFNRPAPLGAFNGGGFFQFPPSPFQPGFNANPLQTNQGGQNFAQFQNQGFGLGGGFMA